MEVVMKEKRKAEIALLIVRFLFRKSGIQHDGFRGEMLEAHEAIGVSAEEIDKFFDALVCETAQHTVRKKIRSPKVPRTSRKIVRMTLMSPRG